MNKLIRTTLLATTVLLGFIGFANAEEKKVSDNYMPSLITKTPVEGRMLAIKIVRKTIGAIQPNSEIKFALRKQYQSDPQLLMYAAELVAIEFKTIAIANNYWR